MTNSVNTKMTDPQVNVVLRNRMFHITNLFTSSELDELASQLDKPYARFTTYDACTLSTKTVSSKTVIESKLKDLNVPTIQHILEHYVEPQLMAVAYRRRSKQLGMPPHYDTWSDWNVVVSLGGSAVFKTNRAELDLKHGDVVVFNGNHVQHMVTMPDNPRLSRYPPYSRIAIQLRNRL